MKLAIFFDTNGLKKFSTEVRTVKTGEGQRIILRAFADNADLAYVVVGDRRYTSGDIYANHSGVKI